jgi:glycosyltransferase involved in cell wall biosynthesis
MPKIKVLHIVHDFLQGGIESSLFYLTNEQKNNIELDISILCLQNENEVINNRLKKNGVPIVYHKLNPFDFNIFSYLKILKLTSDFDLIHFHTFKPILSFFLHFTLAKKVITVHSAGKVNRPDSFNFKFKNFLFLLKLNYSMDAIAYNSSYTKNFWEYSGVGNKKNRVIYNGVPIPINFDKNNAFKAYPFLKGKYIIGTTSRFIKWKRIELLIEAFSLLKDKQNMVLLLVGDGPEMESLTELASQKGIFDNTLFTGYKSNVTDYQDAMNVCVFPSVNEPFGLVAIECLLLGKPVLVMKDGGGITEILEMFEPKYIVNSAQDLSILLEKEYNRFVDGRLIKNSIESIDDFTIQKAELGYSLLYKSIVNNT